MDYIQHLLLKTALHFSVENTGGNLHVLVTDPSRSNVSESQYSHFMDAELEGGGGVEVSLNKSSSRGCCHTTTNPTGYFRGSLLVSLNVWLLTTK